MSDCEHRSCVGRRTCRSASKKAYMKAYNATPERRAYRKAYDVTPERRAYMKARDATPERKAYQRARMKTYGLFRRPLMRLERRIAAKREQLAELSRLLEVLEESPA